MLKGNMLFDAISRTCFFIHKRAWGYLYINLQIKKGTITLETSYFKSYILKDLALWNWSFCSMVFHLPRKQMPAPDQLRALPE
jgi:hypothetical protein